MTIEAELADGRVLEFPDGTDPTVIQATVKRVLGVATKAPETTAKGLASESGKGLLRGAGSVGEVIQQGITVPMGPVGAVVRRGFEALTAPSKELVKATPATDTERFVGTASEVIGAGAAGGGSGTVRAAIGNVVAGLTGAAGEQVGGEVGQAIGTVAPGLVSTAARAAKNTLAPTTAENLRTFREAGATPSVGQATDSVFFRGIENLAAKFPGGAGVIKNFVEKQQAAFGARAKTGVPAEAAGRAIEKGVTGSGGFIERTRDTWRKLDDELGAKVGSDYRFAPSNTLKALDELVQPTAGAEKTTAALVNPKIAQIRENFRADAINNLGGMPFEAVRNLRSRVGAMLDDALVSGIPGGELKKLYAALSDDLEAGAKAVGAGQEFSRQNTFYRSRMARIEDVLDRVVGHGKQPEDIFKTFMPTDPDQAGKVRAVMRSLDPEKRKIVTDAVVNRLGRASAGKQDEVGEVFSSETFLTNWNKLSQGAKEQLFPNHAMRSNVEQIAKAASQIRSGSGIYANPSGTAGSFAAYSVYSSPIAAFATGGVAPLVAAGTAVSTAFIGSKMLTSPKVVEWLAKPVNPVKPGEAAAHLARLSTIYSQTNDPALRAELDQFIATATQPGQR